MDALEFFRARKRMCEKHTCEDCPLTKVKRITALSCYEWLAVYPKEAIAAVEQWAKKNPQKTIMDDFFEKYPNAPKDKVGCPNGLCPKDLGFIKEYECDYEISYKTCKECWSLSLEERK